MTSVDASPVLITDATTGVGTFTVTVVFSEAMDPSGPATPTLTFAPGVASTLTLTGGVWSVGNTTYTATYNVADANVTVASVSIDVTGAKDAAGNAQQDYTPLDEFAIDTANPTGTIAVSDSLITDADVPGPFTVTVTYDEAMDTGIAPTIGFSPSVASTLAFTGGVWSGGGTVYTASYTISDAGVAVPSVDVSASGAQDLVGNTQVTSNATDAFDIDTANPTATIAVSDLLITDADVPGPFTVTVTYDEAMDTGIAPTIGFSPSVASTLAFTGGVWSGGGTVYTASYNVVDANVFEPSVTINVTGAKDLAGNTQVAASAPAVAATYATGFEDPPFSTGSINGQDGWMVTNSNFVQEIVTGVAHSGTQSWHRSNNYVSGSFGDQPFSAHCPAALKPASRLPWA